MMGFLSYLSLSDFLHPDNKSFPSVWWRNFKSPDDKSVGLELITKRIFSRANFSVFILLNTLHEQVRKKSWFTHLYITIICLIMYTTLYNSFTTSRFHLSLLSFGCWIKILIIILITSIHHSSCSRHERYICQPSFISTSHLLRMNWFRIFNAILGNSHYSASLQSTIVHCFDMIC